MLTSRRLAGALCAVILLGACSSGGADPEDGASSVDTASPVVTESPSPAASTTSEDPWAVPDPITEEYVDRVVNRIYEEWGAITREILEQDPDPTGTTPVEVRERIGALFGGEYLLSRFQEADSMLRGERDGLLPAEQLEQLTIHTRDVTDRRADCVLAVGQIDRSTTAEAGTREPAAFAIKRDGSNDTGWRIQALSLARDSSGSELPVSVFLDATADELHEFLGSPCDGDGQ